MNIGDLTDNQLLTKIQQIAKEVGSAGKVGMSAEKRRSVLIKEALKRNLLGTPSKRKWRENK